MRGSSVIARHRARRIADPFAPGAGVEPTAGNSRRFEREQSLAGGYARAAPADDATAGGDAGALAPDLRESGRGEKAVIRPEILQVRQIDRAGNVTGDCVER